MSLSETPGLLLSVVVIYARMAGTKACVAIHPDMGSAALESKSQEETDNDDKTVDSVKMKRVYSVCCLMSSLVRCSRWNYFQQCLHSILDQNMDSKVQFAVHIGYHPENEEAEISLRNWVTQHSTGQFHLHRYDKLLTQFNGYRYLCNHLENSENVPDFVFFSDDDDLWHQWRLKFLVDNIDLHEPDILYSLGLVKNVECKGYDYLLQPSSATEVDIEWHKIKNERRVGSVVHPTFNYLPNEKHNEAQEYEHCCGQLGKYWREEVEKRAWVANRPDPVEHFQFALKFSVFRKTLDALQPLIDELHPTVDLYFVSYVNGLMKELDKTSDETNDGKPVYRYPSRSWDNPNTAEKYSHWLYFYRDHAEGISNSVKQHSAAHSILFGANFAGIMTTDEAVLVRGACNFSLRLLSARVEDMYPALLPNWEERIDERTSVNL